MEPISLYEVYTKEAVLQLMPKLFDEVIGKYLTPAFAASVRERCRKYPPKPNLVTPTFVIKSHTRWHAWYNPIENSMHISTTSALNGDYNLIKGLVYHEAIHYAQELYGVDGNRDPHGNFFKYAMDAINTGEGYECVSIKGDAVAFDMNEKPFRVIGLILPGNTYAFTKVSKEVNLPSGLEWLNKIITQKYPNAKMFSFMCTQGYFNQLLPSYTGKGGKLTAFNSKTNQDEYSKLKASADANIIIQ